MFYQFDQNNSGGSFSDPAIHVFVEADSAEEANSQAQLHGLSFDMSDSCECCGPRWSEVSEWSRVELETDCLMDLKAFAQGLSSIHRDESVPIAVLFTKEGTRVVLKA